MISYILRRLLHLIPLLIGMTLLSFLVIQLAPGDYFDQLKMNPQISPETIEQMRHQFNLDKPLWIQYLKWLQGVVQFDFGYSFTYHTPVSFLIKERLINTLILGVAAMLISWGLAIPIGIYCAVKQYSWIDKFFSFFSYVGMSLPTFFTAFLLLFFAASTGWLPTGGMISANHESMSLFGKIIDYGYHLIIPAIVLGFHSIASLSRIMRGTMLENLRQQYVITARAKGLKEKTVIFKHVLRNSINPMITLFGYSLPGLLSGAAITEIIIAWPGLGRLMLEAIMSQDLFVIMADLLMGGFLLIIGNLIADVMLALSDPRIRYS
ncbi:MAG: ABC transporter permease [bacterium]|nr:ABC transporter permease [bacterium]